jgi:hypothetical protein
MILAVALTASVPAVAGDEPSAPVSSYLGKAPNRHPGQNGRLTAEQQAIAAAAWRYFENNFQPTTCLYNSVDQYPSTTMWDTASAIAGLVAAFEFELVTAQEFDQKMSCMLDSLNRMPLFRDELPNKAYNTISLEAVDYNNNPAEIGVSAIDLGRMLTWLAIVKNRYPKHTEPIDRFVLRWNFCNLVDRGGTLFGAVPANHGGVTYLQEGRLGYEEYAAAGFQLWGFDTTAASQLAPMAETEIYRVPIAYDARDPKEFGAHTYVVTEAFLLSGLELNWDRVDAPPGTDMWQSDRVAKQLAKRVYKAQVRRWRDTGILTARTEHHVDGAPYFVYDTVFSDGVEWNTIADDGRQYPDLAAVSTKAALGLWVLFDTRYTDRLAAAVAPLLDPNKGLYEGYYERNGSRIEAITANTNGIVLETLLYKTQGKLYRHNGVETLWDRVPNGEFSGRSQCLPHTREPAPDAVHYDQDRGRYQASRQSAN